MLVRRMRRLQRLLTKSMRFQVCRTSHNCSDEFILSYEYLGMNEWKRKTESKYYDYIGIENKLNILLGLTKCPEKVHELKSLLRSSLIRNIGGIGTMELHTKCKIGTKVLIEKYVDTVVKSLEYICDEEFEDFTPEEKFEFFYETRQAFGRSALCLSGGATLGMYHLGVIKVLYENQLLPRVISGSSVGSIIASVLGKSYGILHFMDCANLRLT